MGSTSAAGGAARRRSPAARPLLAAVVMVLLGSFLPWVLTGAGNVAGIRGAGLWTMYAAVLGLAGALLRSARLAALHAALLGLVATALPLWQVVHLVGQVRFEGWMPGPGLVLTFGGGMLAAAAAVRLGRAAADPSADPSAVR